MCRVIKYEWPRLHGGLDKKQDALRFVPPILVSIYTSVDKDN